MPLSVAGLHPDRALLGYRVHPLLLHLCDLRSDRQRCVPTDCKPAGRPGMQLCVYGLSSLVWSKILTRDIPTPDGTDDLDEEKLVIFMIAGLWPWALALVQICC